MPTTGTTTLQALVGSNARRLRHELSLTLDQVAVAARARGLRWTESRVSDFEAGRVSANLSTLIGLCLALTDVGGRTIALPELVWGQATVKVNDATTLPASDISRLMLGMELQSLPRRSGQAAPDTSSGLKSPREDTIAAEYTKRARPQSLVAAHRASGATEKKVAASLGISPMLLDILSAALWRRSFAAERDRRAGPGAKAQVRGRVSRELKAEIQQELRRFD